MNKANTTSIDYNVDYNYLFSIEPMGSVPNLAVNTLSIFNLLLSISSLLALHPYAPNL